MSLISGDVGRDVGRLCGGAAVIGSPEGVGVLAVPWFCRWAVRPRRICRVTVIRPHAHDLRTLLPLLYFN